MNVSVFGLGYVGCVSAACLAENGNLVIGVDVQKVKIDLINSGKSPIIEDGVDKLIDKNVGSKKLHATSSVDEAVNSTDVSIICVGTPSENSGKLDLQYVYLVTEQIGEVLKTKNSHHTIVYRSTMLPGSTRQMIERLEKVSGKKAGVDFSVTFNPEFLREGTAVYDYYNPPKIVVGCTDKTGYEVMKRLYNDLDAQFFEVDINEAELVKYVDNAFHALKVAFANEVGRIGHTTGIDSQRIMEIFVADKKLNISEKYFRPGMGYGGSCLPKDLRAMQHFISDIGKMPILSSIEESNAVHFDHAHRLFVKEFPKRTKVCLVGLSFKTGTDDLRESPTVRFAKFLIGEGYEITIYDPYINDAYLIGTNKEFISQMLPNLEKCLIKDQSKISEANILVISNRSLLNPEVSIDKNVSVFDLEALSVEEFKNQKVYVRPV